MHTHTDIWQINTERPSMLYEPQLRTDPNSLSSTLQWRDECMRWVMLTGQLGWLLRTDQSRRVVRYARCHHLAGQGCAELITMRPQKRGNCFVCVAAIRRCYKIVSICASEFTCYLRRLDVLLLCHSIKSWVWPNKYSERFHSWWKAHDYLWKML